MTPVQIGDATLYLGDCMDVLPTLERVDAVITDPPYDNITHKGHLSTVMDRQDLGFDKLEDPEFVEMCHRLVEKANRWVLMTCATTHASLASRLDSFVRVGVWIKPNGAPQFTGDRPGTGWEAVLILHRKGRIRWNGGGRHAVWQSNISHGNHPTEKPVQLIGQWVRDFTDRSETILDPFMGSGTTGVAAIQLGRKFIGIEREPKYFDIACSRIEQAVAQGQLFEPVITTAKQESLL